MVVTSPFLSIFRILLFFVSATNSSPSTVAQIPQGSLNLACMPCPSVSPISSAFPATVLTIPSADIFRMVWLYRSATYILPAPSDAILCGLEKRALKAGPSL